MSIEYAQEYSNHFFHKRIQYRYDKEDILLNFKRLIAFSVLWIVYVGVTSFIKKPPIRNEADDRQK